MRYYTKKPIFSSILLSAIITILFTGILGIILLLLFNYDITGVKAVTIMIIEMIISLPVIYLSQRHIQFAELLDDKIIIQYFSGKKPPVILPIKEIVDIHICIPLTKQDMYYHINMENKEVYEFYPDVISPQRLKEYCQNKGIVICEKMPSDFIQDKF